MISKDKQLELLTTAFGEVLVQELQNLRRNLAIQRATQATDEFDRAYGLLLKAHAHAEALINSTMVDDKSDHGLYG